MHRCCLANAIQLFVISSVGLSIVYSTSDKVYWELISKPAVFGNDIILDCKLPENTCCEMFTRSWFDGDSLRLLIMNGASIKSEKYSESFDMESRSSKLTIHAFNSNDINIPYVCSYGFESYVKNLTLSEDIFERYPSEPYVVNVTTEPGNVLSVNIKLQLVYPKPYCTATFDGTNISDLVMITSEMIGLFYVVVIVLQYTVIDKVCSAPLNVVCKIGTKMFDIQRNVTVGEASSSKEKYLVYVFTFVPGLVVLTVSVVGIAVFRYIEWKKDNNSHGYEKNQTSDLESN